MIPIGLGNGKGGVGTTTLTFQLAALLQRAGLAVTVVETSTTLADAHWCTGRAERAGQLMNISKQAVAYMHLDDCPCRLRDYELGSEIALLDYSNERQNIRAAMRHVQHWVCPFGPQDVQATLLTFERWQALHPDAAALQQTFSAVLTLVPGDNDVAREPRLVHPRWSGDEAVEALRLKAPTMRILQQRLTRVDVMADTYAGRDVFSNPAPEAALAGAEVEALWREIRTHITRGGPLVPPSPPSPPNGIGGPPGSRTGGRGPFSSGARPW